MHIELTKLDRPKYFIAGKALECRVEASNEDGLKFSAVGYTFRDAVLKLLMDLNCQVSEITEMNASLHDWLSKYKGEE